MRLTIATILTLAVALFASAGQALASGPTLPSNDPFYSYTGSLSGVAPGTVLRSRTVSIAENGTTTPITATQILYRTTGEQGQPTATVTTVLRPAVPALSTKVVSYQTAYDGLGSECDPSYTLQGGNSSYSTAQEEEQIILSYLAAGDTVVVPDYEGENLDWAAGQESGYGTLDGIRAAEQLLKLPPATTPVAMVGYSGGSIATEFASELAPHYSPGLDIVGVAEGGVPVDFFHNLAYINGSQQWSGVIPAVLVGLNRAFDLNIGQYLSSYGTQVVNQVQGQCINNFFGNYPGLTYQSLLAAQYQSVNSIPPLVQAMDTLIMSHTGTPKGPLFIGVGNADGTGDGVMVAADDQELAYTYCQRGVSVQFNVYSGDDHTQAAVPFEEGAATFVSQRLNGVAVSNGCGSIAPGNALVPMPVTGGSSSTSSGGSTKTPKLRYRDLGRKKRRHGVVIELWTSTGTLHTLVVTVRHRGHVVTRIKIARLTTHKRAFVVRQRGRMPKAGRYTLTVGSGKQRLLKRTLKVR